MADTSALLDSTSTIFATPKVVAFALDVNPKALTDYEQKDLLVRVGRGKFNFLESVRRVVRDFRGQAMQHRGHNGASVIDASAALKDAQRRMTEIRIARMEGEVIERDALIEAWDAVALQVKQLFLSFPGRARFDLPHLTGADQEVLMRLAHDMLREVATGGPVVLPAPMKEERNAIQENDGR